METKFLVSLILLLQAIFNNANLNIPPDRQAVRCGKNGDFSSEDLLKERDYAFDMLDKRLGVGKVFDGFISGGSRGVLWTKAQCPPNALTSDCHDCVKKTIPMLKKNCPKQKEGAAWSVAQKLYCMVHYTTTPNQINLVEWVMFFFSTTPPAPGTASELEKGLNNLANKLKDIINRNDTKYGSGSISYGPGPRTLYGSMQCYIEVPKENCIKCLSEATNKLHDCCSKSRKPSGRAFSVSCAFWYSHENFLAKSL